MPGKDGKNPMLLNYWPLHIILQDSIIANIREAIIKKIPVFWKLFAKQLISNFEAQSSSQLFLSQEINIMYFLISFFHFVHHIKYLSIWNEKQSTVLMVETLLPIVIWASQLNKAAYFYLCKRTFSRCCAILLFWPMQTPVNKWGNEFEACLSHYVRTKSEIDERIVSNAQPQPHFDIVLFHGFFFVP